MSRIGSNRISMAPSDEMDDAFRRVLPFFTGATIDDTLRALEANGRAEAEFDLDRGRLFQLFPSDGA